LSYVYDVVVKTSRSLYYLMMSFLVHFHVLTSLYMCICVLCVWAASTLWIHHAYSRYYMHYINDLSVRMMLATSAYALGALFAKPASQLSGVYNFCSIVIKPRAVRRPPAA